jgi:MerR family copper efflux transcriptional regulator
MLTVGQVARAAGVSTKAVRLYEARGLLPVAPRTAGGYRVFTESDVDTVRFIRRARSLGLGLDAAAESWPPTAAEQRPATGPLLDQRIAEIDHTLRELRELRATLRELRATLIAARRTDHHTDADRAGDVGDDDPGGICPMIQDATTPGRR